MIRAQVVLAYSRMSWTPLVGFQNTSKHGSTQQAWPALVTPPDVCPNGMIVGGQCGKRQINVPSSSSSGGGGWNLGFGTAAGDEAAPQQCKRFRGGCGYEAEYRGGGLVVMEEEFDNDANDNDSAMEMVAGGGDSDSRETAFDGRLSRGENGGNVSGNGVDDIGGGGSSPVKGWRQPKLSDFFKVNAAVGSQRRMFIEQAPVATVLPCSYCRDPTSVASQRCDFCEKKFCSSPRCSTDCAECGGSYCRACSITSYSLQFERTVCLDCCHET